MFLRGIFRTKDVCPTQPGGLYPEKISAKERCPGLRAVSTCPPTQSPLLVTEPVSSLLPEPCLLSWLLHLSGLCGAAHCLQSQQCLQGCSSSEVAFTQNTSVLVSQVHKDLHRPPQPGQCPCCHFLGGLHFLQHPLATQVWLLLGWGQGDIYMSLL